jgi:hypothetical protein
VKPRGLSLAEVLIALALLTFGFLMVIGLFAQNLQLQSRSAEMTEAVEIARSVMEELKARPALIPDPTVHFQTASQIIPGPPPFPPAPFPSVQGEHGRYTIEIKIEEATPRGVKAVEVYVAWEGGRGVSLQTLFPE